MTINYMDNGYVDHNGYLAQVNALPLDGSEKQASWGKDIRSAKVSALVSSVNTTIDAAHFKGVPVPAATLDTVMARIGVLANNSSAKFWIDNRDAAPKQMLSDANKGA